VKNLTHIDQQGQIRMVDISEKPRTFRLARARAILKAKKETIKLIRKNLLAKGDVLSTARIAGILAAKKTSQLIPLTHPLNLTNLSIDIELKKQKIILTASVKTVGQTGPDIEAITAAAIAAITIYDMVKAIDREMTIEKIQLIEKFGGKSGHYQRRGYPDK